MYTPTKIETFTQTGAHPGNNFKPTPFQNGDALVNLLTPNGIRIFGVIDGAKAPFDYQVNGQANDAYASDLMHKLVELNFGVLKNLDEWEFALESVILSYRTTFDVVRRQHPQYHTEDYRYFNGACAFALVLVDERSGDAVMLQATDCYVVTQGLQGDLKSWSHYDEDAVVNGGLLNRSPLLSDWLNKGLPLAEATKREQARVLENRKRVYNKCQSINNMGMAVMNGDMDLMDCVQVDYFNIHTDAIESFVVMSDGYMCIHDDILKSAQGALDHGVTNFYQQHIQPLWLQQKGHVMTDIICIKVIYT